MANKFNLLDAVEVTPEEVKDYRDARGCGLIEAKNIAKANALYSELTDMRYSLGRFEEMSIEEKFEELLEIFMGAVDTQ